jgi:hypothetical protein
MSVFRAVCAFAVCAAASGALEHLAAYQGLFDLGDAKADAANLHGPIEALLAKPARTDPDVTAPLALDASNLHEPAENGGKPTAGGMTGMPPGPGFSAFDGTLPSDTHAGII